VSSAAAAALVVRCGLVLLFLPFSALDKLLNFEGAVGQASETFSWRPLAILAILCGLGIEIFMSIGIVTGVADRACALVMAGYCTVTAILWKRFWAQGDFWSDPAGRGRTLFWDFLKNVSLGAGFLLLTVGTDGSGLAAFLAHPLASSHPYSASMEKR
jgi:putative oxidoreductase